VDVSRTVLAVALAAMLAASAGTAMAAPITAYCAAQGGPSVFYLTTGPLPANCLATGAGRIWTNGWWDVNLLYLTCIDRDQSPDQVYPHDDWFTITNIGGLGGEFTVDPSAWDAYGELVIGLMTSCNQPVPPPPPWTPQPPGPFCTPWAAFTLPYGETSGTWNLSPYQGALVYAELKGQYPVPEPATLLLVSTALAGLACRLRRRK
jgi:hypothetical protein